MENDKARESANEPPFGDPIDGICNLRIDYTVAKCKGKPLMMTAMVSCDEDGNWGYIVDGNGDMAYASRAGEFVSRQAAFFYNAKKAYRAVRRTAPEAEMRVDGLFFSIGTGFPSRDAVLTFINAALLPIWSETLRFVASCAEPGTPWRIAADQADRKIPYGAMGSPRHIEPPRRRLKAKR